jgi:tRNA A37 threonylcarbamoyltransferase TsaD
MTVDQRIEFVMQSIESHDRQIGELTDAIAKLVAVTNEDATAIRTLARIAESHEKRVSQLEEHR